MRNAIIGLLILASAQTWAHGESLPGPYGGFISMPGAFHVELVPIGGTRLKVYLLDVQFKNPTAKDSSVGLLHGSTAANCRKRENYFVCELPDSVDLKKPGKLTITAVREKQVGNTVAYTLPLKFGAHQ